MPRQLASHCGINSRSTASAAQRFTEAAQKLLVRPSMPPNRRRGITYGWQRGDATSHDSSRCQARRRKAAKVCVPFRQPSPCDQTRLGSRRSQSALPGVRQASSDWMDE